jgi:hypothetical protein
MQCLRPNLIRAGHPKRSQMLDKIVCSGAGECHSQYSIRWHTFLFEQTSDSPHQRERLAGSGSGHNA